MLMESELSGFPVKSTESPPESPAFSTSGLISTTVFSFAVLSGFFIARQNESFNDIDEAIFKIWKGRGFIRNYAEDYR